MKRGANLSESGNHQPIRMPPAQQTPAPIGDAPLLPSASPREALSASPTNNHIGGGPSEVSMNRSAISMVPPSQDPVRPEIANIDDLLRGMNLLGLKSYDVPPPIPPQLKPQMQPAGRLIFSSRPLTCAIGDIESFVAEAVQGNPADYLAIGIERGQGMNSSFYCYYLVLSPLALFIKAPFEPAVGPGGELMAQADSAEMTRSLIGALSNMTDMIARNVASAVAAGKWPAAKKLILVADYVGSSRAGWLTDGRITWQRIGPQDVLPYAQRSLASMTGDV